MIDGILVFFFMVAFVCFWCGLLTQNSPQNNSISHSKTAFLLAFYQIIHQSKYRNNIGELDREYNREKYNRLDCIV